MFFMSGGNLKRPAVPAVPGRYPENSKRIYPDGTIPQFTLKTGRSKRCQNLSNHSVEWYPIAR